MDHNVRRAITRGLRSRGIDVLTAQEDGLAEANDEAILERAAKLGRIVFTNDVDFLAIARQWQRLGRSFAGVVYAHQQELTVGQTIDYLELISQVGTAEELRNAVQFIPLR
jgi:predicted nuclease of predicted toxin-antitoxin system